MFSDYEKHYASVIFRGELFIIYLSLSNWRGTY
jgi:hypothetical protein